MGMVFDEHCENGYFTGITHLWETGWAKAFYLVVVLVISLAIGYVFSIFTI